MGAIVRWIVSKLSAYLAQLAAEVEAYEKEKAEKEAQIAELQKANAEKQNEISRLEATNTDIQNRIAQEESKRLALDAQLNDQLAAIDETESKLKDVLSPKPAPVLSDDDQLERLSDRTAN